MVTGFKQENTHGAAIRSFAGRLSDRQNVPPEKASAAAEEVAAGIELANRVAGVDLIVVARGGGSLEDLWAFNEEVVARAIVASRAPVVSAVGHAVDGTTAHPAADSRALTPSKAGGRSAPGAGSPGPRSAAAGDAPRSGRAGADAAPEGARRSAPGTAAARHRERGAHQPGHAGRGTGEPPRRRPHAPARARWWRARRHRCSSARTARSDDG